MINIDTSILSFQPLVSRGNPEAFLFPLGQIDFQFDTIYQVNVQAVTQAQRLIHPFQAIYMDASQVTTGVTTLTVFATSQSVCIRPGYQGYFPLVCNPGSLVYTFTNLMGKNTYGNPQPFTAILLNIPVVACQWAVGEMI